MFWKQATEGLFLSIKGAVKQPLYRLYERRLCEQAEGWKKPRHLGIVLDGNRRYARSLGLLNVIEGHRRGAEKLQEVMDWCLEFEIPILTIWIFSLDNFQREPQEVQGLFSLIEEKLEGMLRSERLFQERVKIKTLGRLHLLPQSLQDTLAKACARTEGHDRFLLNIAIAYGGREEITDAFRLFLEEHAKGGGLEAALEGLQPEALGPYLYTAGLPDPDLIIRTSGEIRLSGFLLWQSAYSEYSFVEAPWPDFRKIDFLRALRSYHQRQRRFGR